MYQYNMEIIKRVHIEKAFVLNCLSLQVLTMHWFREECDFIRVGGCKDKYSGKFFENLGRITMLQLYRT